MHIMLHLHILEFECNKLTILLTCSDYASRGKGVDMHLDPSPIHGRNNRSAIQSKLLQVRIQHEICNVAR